MPQYKGGVYRKLFCALVKRGVDITWERMGGGRVRWTLEWHGSILTYETDGRKSLPGIDELYELKPGATPPYTWDDRDPQRLIPGAVEMVLGRFA